MPLANRAPKLMGAILVGWLYGLFDAILFLWELPRTAKFLLAIFAFIMGSRLVQSHQRTQAIRERAAACRADPTMTIKGEQIDASF